MKAQNPSFQKNLPEKNLSIVYKDSIDLGFYNKESSKLYKEKQYSTALLYAKRELNLLEKYKIRDKRYTKALYKVAFLYYKTDSLNKALKFHHKIIDLNIDVVKSGQSYCEIGRIYEIIGELRKSIEYYQKGIYLLEENDSGSLVFIKYLNLTHAYFNLSDSRYYKTALSHLKKAERIAKKYNLSDEKLYNLNNQFVVFYSLERTYDFKKAKKYALKNLILGNNDSLSLARLYNNLAFLYLKEKNDSSKVFIKKGLKYSSKNLIRARLYDNYSDYLFEKKLYSEALAKIELAIAINLNKEHIILPQLETINFNDSLDKTHLIHCLQRKSEILNELYKEYKNIAYLEKLLNNVDFSDRLVKAILNDISEEKTKLHWIKKASQAYTIGIKACYILNKNKKAFDFIEKNKALLLIESIYINVEQSNLPKAVVNINRQFKSMILTLENRIEKLNDITLRDSLFNVKKSFDKFKDSVKKNYPNYFLSKLNFNQIQHHEAQQSLKSNEIVVSYIWNKSNVKDESIYGQLITKTKTHFFKVSDINNFKNNLKEYNRLISQPFKTKDQQEEFKYVSNTLYNQIFPINDINNILKDKNIIIIPEGELFNLSFESLIKTKNTFDYLINSNNVSYAYSMSFLRQNSRVKRKTYNNSIAYAPIEFSALNLENLQNTKTEISVIKDNIGGDTFMFDKANKKHFLKKSGESKIIHLATHADASNNPWVAFSDEKLTLYELYTYRNNAELVVLSACNTSMGELVISEGVLSLARGFFYSGANSVISSLWSVNDKATSLIMKDFYKNIKSGESKTLALSNAKREYLKSHTLSEKSPYYWSSFILIGDPDSIDLSSNNSKYYLIFFVLIMLLLFILKKK